MTNIYTQTLANAKDIISNVSDKQLCSDVYNTKVFSSVQIKIPKLNLEQTKVQIKSEEISFHNAPPGISFSMSRVNIVEYAIYNIPVSGDLELFAQLIRSLIDRRTTFMEYNDLCYKEYSNAKISGNEGLINEIKNRVINFTNNVNNTLSQFEQQVNQFHEDQLQPQIVALIKSEIAKRNLRADSESKLNPFA